MLLTPELGMGYGLWVMGKCILILKGGASGSARTCSRSEGLYHNVVTVRVYLYLFPVPYSVMPSYCVGYVRKLMTLHKINARRRYIFSNWLFTDKYTSMNIVLFIFASSALYLSV